MVRKFLNKKFPRKRCGIFFLVSEFRISDWLWDGIKSKTELKLIIDEMCIRNIFYIIYRIFVFNIIDQENQFQVTSHNPDKCYSTHRFVHNCHRLFDNCHLDHYRDDLGSFCFKTLGLLWKLEKILVKRKLP